MSADTVPPPAEDRRAEVEARVRRMAHLVESVRNSPFIPIEPTPKQWDFLLNENRDVLYGGGVGGAKSYAMLAAALMHVEHGSYNALIIRKSYADLVKPKALMDIAAQWLGPTKAFARNGGQEWRFPSGSSLTFGHMGSEQDRFNYDGPAYQFVGFDEVQQIPEKCYRHLFSRLRQEWGTGIPLRARATANPGGLEWVKSRWVDAHDVEGRVFIPSVMTDNPYLNLVEYEQMLAELDPLSRAQMQHGDWSARASGAFFRLDDLNYVDSFVTSEPALRVRGWDLAASEGRGDYAVGCLVAYDRVTGRYRVEDVRRGQWSPDQLEQQMTACARRDGVGVRIFVEQEPGSSGKLAVRDIRRRALAGFEVTSKPSTGSKVERARLPASLLANGDMDLVRAPWNAGFVDELTAFPIVEHDDQVDALSSACHELSRMIGNTGVADVSAVRTFAEAGPLMAQPGQLAERPAARSIIDMDAPSRSPFGNSPGFRTRR